MKDDSGILIGVILSLYIAFGRMVIFTVLILPTHERGRPFSVLIESVSFLRVLKFSFQRSFASWARFAPRNVFYVVVSGIVSFLLFPLCFCVLILYPTTFTLLLFIHLLVPSLGL